ncbi:hypothetical protein [Kitasatospora sp. NPDC004531]
MEEIPQGGAGGVPTPEQDREQQGYAEGRLAHSGEPREDHRAEGRPPTVTHDWPTGSALPGGTLRRRVREDHRAEGRPPTVTHDWPSEERVASPDPGDPKARR